MRVRQDFARQAFAFDRIADVSAANFAANPRRWLAADLLPPGWEEVDAPKEVGAAIERVQAGLSTLREECANRGRNWRKILLQRAREKALTRELGLSLTVDAPAKGTNPAEPAPAAPGDEADQ
jgi:capsid protein